MLFKREITKTRDAFHLNETSSNFGWKANRMLTFSEIPFGGCDKLSKLKQLESS